MSKKYIPTDSDIMAAALVDLLHITELAALLRDGDDLTMAEMKALAAGTTALADTAAQRLNDHLTTTSAQGGACRMTESATLELPSGVARELVELESLLRLVAFATEARRTLDEIETAKSCFPEVKQRIEQMVDCYGQWQEHPDKAAEVLTQVANRLGNITSKL